jgi:AcrR family transcriptional regulator
MERAPATRRERWRSPAGADTRNRQRRGDARRQQILDAAVTLFASRGYRGTGVAALADRVGMTATGLLYYFGSKERLLAEVVAERDRADALEPGASLTLATLRDLGRHNAETATLTRLYAVLTAESFERDEPLHEFFVERYETARGLVRAILEAERARGALRRDVDIAQVAMEIIATLMGLETQWLTDPDRIDLAAAHEAYFDRLIGDLTPSAT